MNKNNLPVQYGAELLGDSTSAGATSAEMEHRHDCSAPDNYGKMIAEMRKKRLERRSKTITGQHSVHQKTR